MPFKEYIRCPVCGKLARGVAIGNAGEHVLGIKKIIKAFGGRGGFLWDSFPLRSEIVEALELACLAALEQVRKLKAQMADAPLEVKIDRIKEEFHLAIEQIGPTGLKLKEEREQEEKTWLKQVEERRVVDLKQQTLNLPGRRSAVDTTQRAESLSSISVKIQSPGRSLPPLPVGSAPTDTSGQRSTSSRARGSLFEDQTSPLKIAVKEEPEAVEAVKGLKVNEG